MELHRGRTGCLEEVGVHFQFLRKMYKNMFVIILFLVLMFGCCNDGKLDESQKANIVIGFKEVELIEGGPGAWKKFGCTCSFRNMYKNTFVMIPLLVCIYLYNNTLVIIPILILLDLHYIVASY